MQLYVSNIQILYMAILHALGRKEVRLNPISPTFFANIAKMLGIDIIYTDGKLDFSSDADIVHNFYESFTPQALVVFQNHGENIGSAKVFVKKNGPCVVAEFFDEELYVKCKLFLEGGIKRGRLWNYDVTSFGIKEHAQPCKIEELEGKIQKSNETLAYLHKSFASNPYFDMVPMGDKTLKEEFPILLKPSLYCPKEDIYQELQERGVEVKVRFKPLYRLTLFKNEPFAVSEEIYKALLTLPLRTNIAKPLMEVLEKYRYRGCSF
ncbi:hypothetical protein NitYY0826_C1869 [Nitratiruptor sp. YY08-26]|uniref:DegT/DnrJ/EryC1/StrS family aminotransferase n=1 Tax=unclassified Nitratiruptor TaxID=2624044 RepID=UPI0019168159|nr:MULTISPECIES: DegT/DnrJ/EryC1/StrS family aminotransferase [unclassified Nitratiruptor]BCD62981.1 hypothetical protein NitYY0813_C1867 [Nitratiruptor sp. YY08-13]BCD66916.1 hypothetical protein NitYY0826_C1869 [Nitratiruptor sp. YY08-26]